MSETHDLSNKILEAYGNLDPEAHGSLLVRVEGTSVTITGTVHSKLDASETLTNLALDLFPGSFPTVSVTNTRGQGLHVAVATADSRESSTTVDTSEAVLDEITVLFQGDMALGAISHNHEYKRENWNTIRKIEACVAVGGFIAPIVLDRNLKIIDGDLRYSIAQELYKSGRSSRNAVPVIVVDAEGVKADFLRLALNRSSEFQRWKYDEVDNYLDSVPVALPLLEPLGFFGERILPESFFGATVLDYEIHEEFKSQQAFYKQEYGLAKWAEIQRERIQAEDAKKKAKRTKKPTEDMVGLFDLMGQVTEEDFLPTYDIEEAKAQHVDEMREVAGTITDNYDAIRKAEKEAKGQAWQTTRRAPKKVIEDLKASVTSDSE